MLTKNPIWQFSRPHTMIGTSISIVSLWGIALSYLDRATVTGSFLITVKFLVFALVSCLLANIYIVGLNQLTDIEIDRINKPYLPLVSGKLTVQQGQLVIGICLALSLLIALSQGFFLFVTVLGSILLGTAYSLPPFRLKRFPLGAALCIIVVRGIIVNLGIYGYFARVFHSAALSPVISGWARPTLLTGFMVIFGCVIALFKDIPDTVGDKENNIKTFSLKWGRSQVFVLCSILLAIDYLVMIGIGWLGPWIVGSGRGQNMLWISNLLFLGLLLWNYYQVQPQSEVDYTQFYQFIWKLFYLEYIFFSVACLLALTV